MTNRYTLEYWKDQLDEIWLEQMSIIHRGKSIEEAMKLAYGDLISQPDRLEKATANDFKRLINSWLSNRKPEKKFVKRDISKL